MVMQAIAHFGTTLAEAAPREGVDLDKMPFDGDLERTDKFLTKLGMEVFITNLYPGMGRQYIYRRGNLADVDYFEKDTFTSFTATLPPVSRLPRVGETIFRITHHHPIDIYQELLAEDLIVPMTSGMSFINGVPTLTNSPCC